MTQFHSPLRRGPAGQGSPKLLTKRRRDFVNSFPGTRPAGGASKVRMGELDRKGPAMTTRSGVLAFFVLLAAAAPALAQGLVIPNEPDVPPLALTRHRVRVEIDT